MYQIFCDDFLLHSEIDDYRLLNVLLTMEVNTAGSLSFTILPDHPNLSALGKLKPAITVIKNGSVYWKGRIIEDTLLLYNSHNVYCEGKLKTLEDTIVRPAVFDGTAAEIYTAYLNAHNSQVSEAQKIKVGTIDVTGDIYRDQKSYESTYSRVQDLFASLGGYLFLRYEQDGDYLDWVTDFTVNAAQQITLGENILDLSEDVSAKDTYTACIPLGAYLTDSEGNKTDQRLTVASVQGVDYVFDQAKVNEYGWRYAPAAEVTWDDIEAASELLSKAQDYLSGKGIKLALALELTALDLAFTRLDINSFNFCEYVTVNSPLHEISETYLLSKVAVDISNPANTKITLGELVLTLTDKTKKDKEKATFTINELITALTGTAADVGNEITQRERYIRYVDGIIELGETDSDLKMRLSNTELSFWESLNGIETKVAYISNPTGNPGDSKLYVENGMILQSLAFGAYGWDTEDNGSVSLSFKG